MFNNPNFFSYQAIQPRTSLLRSLRALNFSELLNGTQKTLNVINQAIPIFHQIKPLWNNTKTIFKIATAINEDHPRKYKSYTNNNQNINKNIINNNHNQKKNIKYNEPIFFL